MIKKLTAILTIFFMVSVAQAHECDFPKPECIKEKNKQINEYLIEKLNLTQAQQEQLKKNRQEHKKEMKKIVKQMEAEHDKIRNVYLTGIPKFQADIRTAPSKTKLVILKQNADKLREENRKKFVELLTPEQKLDLEKIKKEHPPKTP